MQPCLSEPECEYYQCNDGNNQVSKMIKTVQRVYQEYNKLMEDKDEQEVLIMHEHG